MTESDPRSSADWAAYRALPGWEVTVRLSRTARFRCHAASAEEARERVTGGRNGVAAVEDLYSPGEPEITDVISVEAL